MFDVDHFSCLDAFSLNGRQYHYFSLPLAEKNGLSGVSRLPISLKILLENVLRHQALAKDGESAPSQFVDWLSDCGKREREIAFRPARVLMQDFTGVPAVVDLAAMRDAISGLGFDPGRINPLTPVDLVIDHSVMVDFFGNSDAFSRNVALEYQRNQERYRFLKWGQKAFKNFRVVPPGTGICHQVNLEYLSKTVWTQKDDERGVVFAYPDTLVGTDSHTTMVNGLSVLGWGVGGIEAEAAMLGQPVSMLLPEVVGFRLTGNLPEGTTATDLVLTVTEILRKQKVVGKFVEFFGPGLRKLSLEDRATLANMAPEYGATCGFFPITQETLQYLLGTGRSAEEVNLVEFYAKTQGLFVDETTPEPLFTEEVTLDLSTVEPSLAGPKRPQDRVRLAAASPGFQKILTDEFKKTNFQERFSVSGETFDVGHGDVVIAAITSCTNTSNPSVMVAAGLVAQKALALGLKVKPWVKTSLAPGSQVVSDYLGTSGLQKSLDGLGFQLVGYGCTTCIGNSGPLSPQISEVVRQNDLVVASVLSGNRNFEGRVNPDVRANYLASPPLVVAYALAGTLNCNLASEPLGYSSEGHPVYLRDIWPSSSEISKIVRDYVTKETFENRYRNVFDGDAEWQKIEVTESVTYPWESRSTYVQKPPYFSDFSLKPSEVQGGEKARILAIFGDSITTDHISPAGSIKTSSPAGRYLIAHGVSQADFNSYGARRGNHEVMMRGTFANIRIKNLMVPGVEGGVTVGFPSGETMDIYDAAMQYQKENVPLVVFAGHEYGTGSSRDWAAKGTQLLGVKAVVAQSFERIHRSNLIGMGVLPLQFLPGQNAEFFGFSGQEMVGLPSFLALKPRQKLQLQLEGKDGKAVDFEVICRIDTFEELEYFKNGGILSYVLRKILGEGISQKKEL